MCGTNRRWKIENKKKNKNKKKIKSSSITLVLDDVSKRVKFLGLKKWGKNYFEV